ncbi:MAG: DEAD/DEAH box helicase [Deltaproteobacteria bacterium]|nr:DEAD/DEAH box helicase [Deltaproteobacteria bacterium]
MQNNETSFSSLDLPEQVLQGVEAAGFTHCTPIQAKVFPLALEGRDVAAKAQTGTGKTAAFLITILTRLLRSKNQKRAGSSPRAFIVAPTRELAVQIYEEAKLLGQGTSFSMLAVYGGVDYQKQRDRLKLGVDILVGTPGRLIDYYKQRVFDLKGVEIVVVDEADRMFDMGFIKDLRYMMRRLPHYTKRQSMLFSATLSYRVMELGYEHMNLPVQLSVSEEKITADKVDQVLYHTGMEEKPPLLLGLLKREGGKRVLLFVNTKVVADRVTRLLNANGYKTRAITGDIPQTKRQKILESFKAGTLPILVATDVASRGLHIEGVTHVINYDLPQDAEDYVHRIGRTARAGASGKAISLACERYVYSLEEIEALIGGKIPTRMPDEELLVKEYQAAPPRKHRRPSPTKRGAKSSYSKGRSRQKRGQPSRRPHQGRSS